MPSVTLPGAPMNAPRDVPLTTADDSGYLIGRSAGGSENVSAWLSWDGSPAKEVPSPKAVNGGFGLEQVKGTNSYLIRHYATGEVARFDLPAGDTATGIFAENRLLALRTADGRQTLHLWETPEAGGPPVDRPVSGTLDTLGRSLYTPASDTRGAAFWYKPVDGSAWRTALLDFATARLTYVPSDDFGLLEYPHLADGRIVFYALDKKFTESGLYVIDRDRPQEPGTMITDLDSVEYPYQARVLGDWLIHPTRPGGALQAVPVVGGATRTLLARAQGTLVDGADGSLYVVGGSDSRHWAVRHVTLGADGEPSLAPLAAVPPVSVWEAGGLAVDQGRLLVATESATATDGFQGTSLYGSDLSLGANGSLTVGPGKNLGDLGYHDPGDDTGDPGSGPQDVACYGECLRLSGTGEASVAHGGYGVWSVVAASGRYTVIRTSYNAPLQLRRDTTTLATGSWPSVALWGSTLWRPGTAPGTVSAFSLPSLGAVATESVGATCVPTDLQVVGRWIYWSCGPDSDAGVYDRTTKKLIHVPSGYAQLADGYLVSQDDTAGKLMITYFPGAVPADRTGTSALAPLFSHPLPLLPVPADQRGRYWAVDRFGGPVAHLTGDGDLTVTWPRVTTSPISVISTDAPAQVDLRSGADYTGVWDLSGPVTWAGLTITGPGGAVVRTIERGGTEIRGRFAVTWDGRFKPTIDGPYGTSTVNAGLVPTGTYRWTLKANGTDHTTTTASGTIAVRSVERHDYGRDGIGDLLTLDGAGNYAIHPGNGKGGIDSAHRVSAGGWPSTYYLTAIGDLTGDRCNDLVARTSTGSLVRYDGTCGKPFSTTGPHAYVAGGFNAYNVITSPGDLNGDGRADLLTRDTAGNLWLYTGNGKGGLNARVGIASGVTAYNRLIGAGDLNGDGLGDLLGRDTSGNLWRWLANGKGGFNARVRIATGVSAYNTLLVPGDLTGDGRPDLVGRDSAGRIYRWSGNTKGTFDSRAQIATGWNTYRSLS